MFSWEVEGSTFTEKIEIHSQPSAIDYHTCVQGFSGSIGESFYYSILMLRVFRSSQNDMIRSGTQKLYDYLLRTLSLLMYFFTERCEWQSTDAPFQGDFSKSDSMTNVFQLPFLSIIKVDLPAQVLSLCMLSFSSSSSLKLYALQLSPIIQKTNQWLTSFVTTKSQVTMMKKTS